MRLACSGATACKAKLTLELERAVRVKGRRTLRRMTLGTSAVLTIPAGTQTVVRIRLDASARALLLARHGLVEAQLALVTTGHKQHRAVTLVASGEAPAR